MGAVPVEADDGGVVLGRAAFVGVADRADQGAHDFPRVLGGGFMQERGEVDRFGVAFLHAVGMEQEPIPRPQAEVLHRVRVRE